MSYYSNPRYDVINLLPDIIFKNILEIGGGTFSTLKAVSAKYKSVSWGVDVYDSNPEINHFINGSFIDPKISDQLENNSFDLIIANDVLEHIVDTELFFETLALKKSRDGLLAMSVPNARQVRLSYTLLIQGSFPRTGAGLFDRTHVRWFCRSDVAEFAKNAGLELISHKTAGRLVPEWASRMRFSELLALHNLFVFR
jgi:2-polyprenyl-3-methyl-5-hydroxy-6-metoxy-1,4-benzoquinol methylase